MSSGIAAWLYAIKTVQEYHSLGVHRLFWGEHLPEAYVWRSLLSAHVRMVVLQTCFLEIPSIGTFGYNTPAKILHYDHIILKGQ